MSCSYKYYEILQNDYFSCSKTLRCIYLAYFVKMPTIVGILIFTRRIDVMLSYIEQRHSTFLISMNSIS